MLDMGKEREGERETVVVLVRMCPLLDGLLFCICKIMFGLYYCRKLVGVTIRKKFIIMYLQDIGWVILLKEASWGYEKGKMQLLCVFCMIRGVMYLICCGYDYGKGDYALLFVDEV